MTITTNDPQQPTVDIPVIITVDHSLDVGEGVSLEETLFGNSDCAPCHADRAEGLSGIWAYDAVCAMCHGSIQRYTASLEADLFDRGTLRTWIADGSGQTGMPGYSLKLGGPLTDEQIDTLVELIIAAQP